MKPGDGRTEHGTDAKAKARAKAKAKAKAKPRPKSKPKSKSYAKADTGAPQALHEIPALPTELMLRDRAALQRDLRQLKSRRRDGKAMEPGLTRLASRIESSRQRYQRRAASVPKTISFPDDLPITGHREELLRALREQQVIILAGETGSGKTTQLPKLCLQAGRGVAGLIGHTQPRRLAAQAVASRVAEELGVELGGLVGYQVRFSDKAGDNTLVKMMTDGILLNEIQRDRLLRRYDTLIIDEAHERSLNIDFLLGYLKTLLPSRPELRLVVTSATIDVERFSAYFAGAPVFEVSGRSYPVELRYRPVDADGSDQADAVVEALTELNDLSGRADGGPRDVLVFHSGEQEIRETAHALRRARLPGLEVLPLYSRLSSAEQARVLRPRRSAGQRVVLSTNVAETSLTVPGIGFVIDPGYARISRYSLRSKVQRLPIEAISQASANQRMGRCGRLAPGVCIRLFSAEDYEQRPAFTEPEIRRTNLAAVILQMHQLGLGDVAAFPFLDAPDARQIGDGIGLLEELGALAQGQLTPIGESLARLPVDPRIGRMLLAAAEQGSLREMLVVASFLGVQDPRERPVEKQQAADQQHARFRNRESDFLAILALWDYVELQRQDLSASQFRRLCQKEFLNWLRLREWRDVHRQLKLLCRELGLRENNESADYEAIHRALLAGMLSLIGNRLEEREFEGVRNRRFLLHPSSGLARKPPKWVVCAELVETARLYGRVAARIEPEWVLPWTQDLLKREYYEPAWRQRQGRVMARERLRLYGLVVADGRWVDYAPIAPAEAREIFIQSALVEEDYRSRQAFWIHNLALRAELADLEARGRRRDLVVEDRTVHEFYAAMLPERICDRAGLERWLKRGGESRQKRMMLSRDSLMRLLDHGVSQAQFPDHIEHQGMSLALHYRFEPSHPDDGVSVSIPLLALNRLDPAPFDWLVPGLLRDKCITLLKLLPKSLRRQLVPIPDTVDAMLPELRATERLLLESMAAWLQSARRLDIDVNDWPLRQLEPFYRMRFVLLDIDGAQLDDSRDLVELQRRHAEASREQVQEVADPGWKRDGMCSWECATLPEEIDVAGGAGFPALVDQGDAVGVRLYSAPEEAASAHRQGTIRLLRLAERQTEKILSRRLLREPTLMLGFRARFSREQLLEDLLQTACVDAFLSDSALPRQQAEFDHLRERGRGQLIARAGDLEALLQQLAVVYGQLAMRRSGLTDLVYQESLEDVDCQLETLMAPGFLLATPPQWRLRLPVYLQALEWRLAKLPERLPRDLEWTWELASLAQLAETQEQAGRVSDSARQEYRWLLEEYRISLFAQQLGTAVSVSSKRLEKLLGGH